MKTSVMKKWSIVLVAFLTCAFFSQFVHSAEGELLRHKVLFCLSKTDGQKTIVFDGYRTAKLAEELSVTDKTGGEIDTLEKLDKAIGTSAEIESVANGAVAGDELGDALYADIQLEGEKIVSITVVARERRPLIGIAWVKKDKIDRAQGIVAADILRNGGKAYFLKQLTNAEECEAEMKKVDGIFFTGGEDVNPKRYQEEAYPHGSIDWNDARDESDILACRWAVEHDVPLLAVCRGQQMFNVALGGALIQDIPTYNGKRVQNGEFSERSIEVVADDGVHGVPCETKHYRVIVDGLAHSRGGRHQIGSKDAPGISVDSKFLLKIVGRPYCESVYTSHHQAADPTRLGKGVKAVAMSPDGIVEALEYQANKFALTTQFHYEYDTLDKDPAIAEFSNSFFKAFIDAAR